MSKMGDALPLENTLPPTASGTLADSLPLHPDPPQTDIATGDISENHNNSHDPEQRGQYNNICDETTESASEERDQKASSDLTNEKISDVNEEGDEAERKVQTNLAAMAGERSNQTNNSTKIAIISPPTLYGFGFKKSNVADDGKDDYNKDGDHHQQQHQQQQVYRRRWYVLAVYCLFALNQECVWNTFGPISHSSERVFGWSNGDVFLLTNWGPITYIISGVFFSWMIDVKGLRWSSLSSAFLVTVGTALRCITMETPAATWLIHTGQLLNGLGGPVAMGGPPIVSAVWFPTEERATATAIGTTFNFLGFGLSFLLGPYLVDDFPSSDETLMNSTLSPLLQMKRTGFVDNTTSSVVHDGFNSTYPGTLNTSEVSEISKISDDIRLYMIIDAAWSAALFLMILIYFPAKPPTPPCTSAGIQRENFLHGLKHLLRRKQFWLVAFISGVPIGALNCWLTVISVDLGARGISEKEAGWIGFYSILSAALLMLVIGRIADVFARAMKWFVFTLYLIGTVALLLFGLACMDVVTPSVALFYATVIISATVLNSTIPLIYELACELAYPTGEGTTNIVLTIVSSVSGLLFLFVGMIQSIGTLWMSWTLFGTCVCCLPLLMLLKERFGRRDVDEAYPNISDINTEITVESGNL
ncbi:disrupted in renal carcinoma protein 2-like [Pomacea canaliculata]|uniref:disrupted in renal carcinoma protein 2-like n=1 Tax=Pomacea canaliculata TaxID=400727 RepID=UPI000D73D178|nr:disrupted in renal carcinoma protein 2-like [Pomacea canaliculata]